jgi:hypothetical protein
MCGSAVGRGCGALCDAVKQPRLGTVECRRRCAGGDTIAIEARAAVAGRVAEGVGSGERLLVGCAGGADGEGAHALGQRFLVGPLDIEEGDALPGAVWALIMRQLTAGTHHSRQSACTG